MNKKSYAIFWKCIYSLMLLLVLAAGLLIRGNKTKEEFFHCEGKIEFVTETYQEYPLKNPGQYRYLKIDCYKKPFQVYVGDSQKLDVQAGDVLSVYYDDNEKEDAIKINRLLQYVDKNGTAVFVRSAKDKIGGIVGIIFCLVMAVLLIYLKKRGTIH